MFYAKCCGPHYFIAFECTKTFLTNVGLSRIVGGKEVNPKYKLPYQVLVSVSCFQASCVAPPLSPPLYFHLDSFGTNWYNFFEPLTPQPCASNGGCLMCGGTILNKVNIWQIIMLEHISIARLPAIKKKKMEDSMMFHDVQRYVVTAAHCLYNGNTEMTLKGGAKFRVMVGEHDHCKHNEARRSSKKQTKTTIQQTTII